ncbi:hypothetical protein ASE04_18920 [Rhizobium sp. Root708]|uniref:hypothetical protein n=1 Tax=Rhizobium sp. Root708 TaxID=1736592 RepID=UPI0006FEE2C9|nr:hypothetical protein [Rhizobium sp. Root708]KRB49241.1 hypothetical protein ASE04_18920 [Rhizobium sp. Root708]
MTKTPITRSWADEISGTYWTMPAQASLAEIHPLLMAVLLVIAGYQDWSIYSADAYDMAWGGPLGSVEVAFETSASRLRASTH